MIEAIIGKASGGEDLSVEEMTSAIDAIMRGDVEPGRIGVFLIALREKGETVEEVVGAATAMRRHMTKIKASQEALIDTCGTGGDHSGTFNISTAAALVTAAAGVPVAKHGNRAVTSKTGSADVLAALGVNVDADVPVVEKCLAEIGIGFCFAPRVHQSMKNVATVRKQLGVPTVFNMLGPLTNPASAPYQVIGVGRGELRMLLARALVRLDAKRAIVVHGSDGLDEVTPAGATLVAEATPGGVREFEWTPEDFGLPVGELSPLTVSTPEESAAMIRKAVSGEAGPARDVVVLNAAAALWTAGKSANEKECAALAGEAIDSGAVKNLLERLVALSNA